MAELLIVAESPAKAAFMKEHYGGRADCIVCDWPLFRASHRPASGAPSGLLFQFEGIPAGQECITALHAYRDKEIVLAFDTYAQSNYLCWQISGYVSQIGGKPTVVKRLSATAFNKEYVEAALPLAAPVDKRQGLSHYGRLLFDDCLARHLIRLVGTDRGPGNLPLRYNSLTTLFLLAEREQERLMFPFVQKWRIQASLASGDKKFTASLAKGLDLAADALIGNEAKAHSLRDQFGRTPFVVDAVSRSPLTIPTPEPYQLAELLHDAIALRGLGPAAAMAVIQKLFHGTMVKGSPQGLITSASPETRCPLPETISALRRQVAILYGESALADCAAPTEGIIIPVRPELCGADLTIGLTQDEAALYDLIRNRALASQMQAAVGETITVDLLAGKEHIFQTHFHELAEPGFLQHATAKLDGILEPCPLPEIHQGLTFLPTMMECQGTSTEDQAAERYTIETLLTALADFSIAADPVTIAMIDGLRQAGYFTITPRGALEATDNTAKVVTILNRAFPRMQGINLAAYIEQTINETTSNRKDLLFALKQFDQTLLLHGTLLVKTKLPSKVQPRTRTSSTIIKQAIVPLEVETSPPKEKGSPPPEEISPQAVQAPPVSAPEPIEQPRTEPSQEPTTAESMPAEILLPEEGEKPSGTLDNDLGLKVETTAEDGHGPEAWPDDLQRAFTEALSASPPDAEAVATSMETQAPPAGDPARLTSATQSAEGQRRCPACRKPLLLKEDSFGVFWGCSGFPGCRYSEAVGETGQALSCPLCGQGLSRKQTPTGKSFYVCENQECQFMSWSRPHYLPCGLCDSPYLVEKTERGRTSLRCPRAGCPYGQPLPEEIQEAPPPLPNAPRTKKVLVRRLASGPSLAAGSGGATKKVVRVVRRRK